MWGHALDIPLQIVKILFIFGRRLGDLVVNGKHCENSVRLYLAKIVNSLYASVLEKLDVYPYMVKIVKILQMFIMACAAGSRVVV